MKTLSDTGNEENLKMISELQSKLEDANAQLISEREKVVCTCFLLLFHIERTRINS